jgi:hypothetical protein
VAIPLKGCEVDGGGLGGLVPLSSLGTNSQKFPLVSTLSLSSSSPWSFFPLLPPPPPPILTLPNQPPHRCYHHQRDHLVH